MKFEEMNNGAKIECFRDFMGSVTGNISLASNFMNALRKGTDEETYANIVQEYYNNCVMFRDFCSNISISDRRKEMAAAIMHNANQDKKKRVKNPDFGYIMKQSFDGSADYMPMGSGYIYMTQAYTKAKKIWPSGIIEGIPVSSVDTNKVYGYIKEFVNEEEL